MDKNVILIIGAVVLVGLAFWVWQSGVFTPAPNIQPAQLPAGIVLFYSPDCPHCKVVEDFITQNNVDQKVQYSRVEVPFGTRTSPQLEANALAALQKAQQCKIDINQGLSIPFLWDGDNQKCYLGQDEVINFFKEKAGIK